MTRSKGLHYERDAQDWLQKQGLKPLYQNYSCRYGEVDLVMLDKSCLCFIEVKFRASQAYGGSAYSITTSKQQKLVYTAQHFLARHSEFQDCEARFDALLIDQSEGQKLTHSWIKNAFYAD